MPETAAGLTPASEQLIRDWDKYPDAIDGNEVSARLWLIERQARALGRAEALAAVRAAVDNLTTWPRVSYFAYDARVRGVPVNPTEDRVVVDRAAVLDAIDNLETPHA